MQSTCPNCGTPLEIGPELIGRQIKCPRCATVFQAGSPTEEPFPFVEPVRRRTGKFHPVAKASVPRESSDSIWSILTDWKFKKYLTPKIVRVSWALAVASFALLMFLLVVSLIAEAIPKHRSTRVTSRGRVEVYDEVQVPSMPRSTVYDALTNPISVRIFITIWAVYVLLWIRVALESVIVIFNIATSVGKIEKVAEAAGNKG